jgi:hypothetical protein
MEKDNEAVALATTIFVAGFFLGVGTGMLLAPYPGTRTRERLKTIADDLVGDAAKSLEGIVDKGKQFLG